MTTPCPICSKPQDAKYQPFCSKRCADIDLSRWLKGGYVIPGGRAPEGEEEAVPGPRPAPENED